MKKKLALMAASAMITGALTQAALADVQTVTANIAFLDTLTLTLNADINFGTVQANRVGDYTIDATTATVTTPAFPGPNNGLLVDQTLAEAGDITITGVGSIDISVGAYTANLGVTPSAATCKYGIDPEVPCTDASLTTATAPGAGTNLLLGVTVHADGTQNTATSAAPTFDVTVVFS